VLFFVLVGAMGENGNRCSPFWRARPLVFLGEVSYSLYMTHVVLITLIVRFFPYGFDSVPELHLAVRIMAFLVCVLILLAGTLTVHYLVERPLRNLSRGTRAKGTDDATSPRLGIPISERLDHSGLLPQGERGHD
jgi:peptidoglycan/LPS O-acetylase OafA/YrhL